MSRDSRRRRQTVDRINFVSAAVFAVVIGLLWTHVASTLDGATHGRAHAAQPDAEMTAHAYGAP